MLPRLQMQSAERDCGFPIRLNVASSPMGCPQQVPRLYRVRFGCQIVVESRGGLIKLAMFHEVASLSDLWIWRPSNLFLDRFIHLVFQPRVAERHSRNAPKEETTDVRPMSNAVPRPHSVIDFHQHWLFSNRGRSFVLRIRRFRWGKDFANATRGLGRKVVCSRRPG